MDARERVGHFIVKVYNQKRPHSALGYLTNCRLANELQHRDNTLEAVLPPRLTPVEFEQQYLS